eukprot:SAG11_NODE_1266_length_5342_cov_4.156369_2_plen_77_part_00
MAFEREVLLNCVSVCMLAAASCCRAVDASNPRRRDPYIFIINQFTAAGPVRINMCSCTSSINMCSCISSINIYICT